MPDIIVRPGQEPIEAPQAHNYELVHLMADRYLRSAQALEEWARVAKKCVDFAEGQQWDAATLKKLHDENRPAFTFNKIGRLVRLVLGYHRNNRLQTKFLPGWDGSGSEEVAQALTKLDRQTYEINQGPFVDTEVFMDGMLTGRGLYDQRLSFDDNELGEVIIRASDPFSTLLDPDADEYDLNKHNFVGDVRWVSIDEVEFTYGRSAAAILRPAIGYGTQGGPMSTLTRDAVAEIAPWRTFGGVQGDAWNNIESYFSTSYDPLRKTVRLLDMQHHVRVLQQHIINLETGERQPIPAAWDAQRVAKVMQWAEMEYARRGQPSPLRIQMKPRLRVRWTTMVGDLIVYDDWSPYESYTKTGFFPWFRRGKTRGMVEDLIDPQQELNKRRSSRIDATVRTAHSGWMYHEKGLDKENQEKLRQFGAMPGLNLRWQGEPHQKPERIQAAAPPIAFERLEQSADQDLTEISGINESLLGELDRVQSGRALEARQRQGVLSIQVYMDNMSRTKELSARKRLELYQNHYTEERTYRILGDDGSFSLQTINQRIATGQIANDVTSGRYSLVIDETPLSASFAAAQFDEMITLVKEGVVPIPVVQDVLVDASSMPQKELVKTRIKAFMAAQGIPMGDDSAMLAGNPMAAAMMRGAGAGLPPGAGMVPPQGPAPSMVGQAGSGPIPVGNQGVPMRGVGPRPQTGGR